MLTIFGARSKTVPTSRSNAQQRRAREFFLKTRKLRFLDQQLDRSIGIVVTGFHNITTERNIAAVHIYMTKWEL